MTQIREMMFESLKEQYTVQRVRENLTSDIKVTPAEVRRYFKDMPEDSLPWISDQVGSADYNPATSYPTGRNRERVKAELRDYTDRNVNNGESSFSTLAILIRRIGFGSLWRKNGLRGAWRVGSGFANVAFSLTDPKKISKVVESEYGFHIIQLVDKRGDKVKVRHILRKPKLAQADIDTTMVRMDSIAEDIRKEKYSFEEAATFLSDDKDSRNNRGLMTNVKFDQSVGDQICTSRFQLQELPAEVAKVVSTMKTERFPILS